MRRRSKTSRGCCGAVAVPYGCCYCGASVHGVPYNITSTIDGTVCAAAYACSPAAVCLGGSTFGYTSCCVPVSTPMNSGWNYCNFTLQCNASGPNWYIIQTIYFDSSCANFVNDNQGTQFVVVSPTQHPLAVTFTPSNVIPGGASAKIYNQGFRSIAFSDATSPFAYCQYCNMKVCTTTCAGTAVSSGTVNLTTSECGSYSTNTTDGTGCTPSYWDITNDNSTNYSLSASRTGYAGSKLVIPFTSLGCPGIYDSAGVVYTATLPLDNAATFTSFTLKGCNNFTLGATHNASATYTVSVSGNNNVYTTDTNGVIPAIAFFNGSYPWTISDPTNRFASVTGTTTVSSCVATGKPASQTLTAATGYACYNDNTGYGCAYPEPTTLYCTFSIAGMQSFVYSAGSGWWVCSFTYLTVAYVINLKPNEVQTATANGVSFTVTVTNSQCPPSFFMDIDCGTKNAVIGTGHITE
jgi:hypothetical protein